MLGKGGISRTEPTIRVPASGLSQRSVPEASILWLEANVTLIFPSSEIGVEMEAQVPCGGSHPPFPCRAIFCLVIHLSISSTHNALAQPHHLYNEYSPYTHRDSLEPPYRYRLSNFHRLGPDRCLRGKRLIFSASHPPSGVDGQSPPTTGVSRRSALASWAPCWPSASSQWPYANAAVTSQDHCSAPGLAKRECVAGHRYLHHHFQ